MYEEKRIKQGLIRNTLLFFIVFALIFAALGVFVYQVVSSNIFRSVDAQLTSLASNSIVVGSIEADDVVGHTDVFVESFSSLSYTENGQEEISISQQVIEDGPQVIYLFRDSTGALMNISGLYSNYPDYLKTIPFDKDYLHEVYSFSHEGKQYRGVNEQVEGAEEFPDYFQAIYNVDSEIAILDQFTQTLVIGLLVALVACAAASYFLSKRTIRPIAQAWNKQTEFVQNASHELRTPLAVIHATQELLLENPQARIVDHFEDVSLTLEETDRLSRLTEDLLLLSAADADKLQLEPSDFSLDQLAEEISARYEDIAAAQKKTITFKLNHDDNVDADQNKIQQVISILLDNALKYSAEGDTISIATAAQGNEALIIIADTGIGIDDEDIEKVFDRFYRADKARTRTKDGLGLGLSIARSIVESHNGTIRMEHNEPKGVQVVITLPQK